jgi:hypothetical protein
MGSPQSNHRVVYALLMQGFDDDPRNRSSRSTNFRDAILSPFRAPRFRTWIQHPTRPSASHCYINRAR